MIPYDRNSVPIARGILDILENQAFLMFGMAALLRENYPMIQQQFEDRAKEIMEALSVQGQPKQN
jgi:hypothetical protein